MDGFSEPRGEHQQHQLEIFLGSQLKLRVFQPRAGSSSSTPSLQEFSEPRGEHHQHQLEISQLSTLAFQPTARLHFDPKEPANSWNFFCIIGRIQRTAERASAASAGNLFGLTAQTPGLSTHSRVAAGMRASSASAGNLLGLTLNLRVFQPRAGSSSSTPSLQEFSEPRGEHHQHQLEISQLSTLAFQPTARLHFDPKEPANSWNFFCIIGRIQRTAGRASAASAGNLFGLTAQTPGLSTHQQGSSRNASIISISWKSFWTHSSNSGSFNPEQVAAVQPHHCRNSANRGASIISISWKSHNSVPWPFNPQQGCISTRRSQQTAGISFVSLDGFSEPRGEHQQHQLEIFLGSQLKLRVFQPTAG